jgi:hypothetical protein
MFFGLMRNPRNAVVAECRLKFDDVRCSNVAHQRGEVLMLGFERIDPLEPGGEPSRQHPTLPPACTTTLLE